MRKQLDEFDKLIAFFEQGVLQNGIPLLLISFFNFPTAAAATTMDFAGILSVAENKRRRVPCGCILRIPGTT